MSSPIKKIRANIVSLPKILPQSSSLDQRKKLISSKLDEGYIKGEIRLAASDDRSFLITFFLITLEDRFFFDYPKPGKLRYIFS